MKLSVAREEGDEIAEGSFACSGCGRTFWIVEGVPRMLGPELYQPPERVTAGSAGNGRMVGVADERIGLKRRTIENFGHQWTRWSRFGWTDADRPTDEERETFLFKSLLRPSELAGKVALDAGCGNGRYTYWVAQSAGEVIAVDLGPAVDSAYRNLRHLSNVHVVQGDLFRLPIREASVDVIFSIGVLMHTGDAREASAHLASLLPRGGSLTVHLYHRGNPLYELNDALLRRATTRLSIERLTALSAGLARVGRLFDRHGLLGYANLVMRLHPDLTANFDWYAAPIATHHTYEEVYGWFRQFGLEVVGDNRPRERAPTPLRRRIGRALWRDWAMTVRGVRAK